ncbi:MAG: IS3 family transposase [Cetobacterium sp.]
MSFSFYCYNNYRCQWNLKKLTPVQYKNQLLNI